MTRPLRLATLLFALILALSGCRNNAVQSGDEAVKAQWTEILTQYRQRSELVPQLVALVKQHARHQREVLKRGTEARARASAIPGDDALLADEDAFRHKYRETVTSYNATIHSFPSILSAKLLGATERPTLVEDGAQGEGAATPLAR